MQIINTESGILSDVSAKEAADAILDGRAVLYAERDAFMHKHITNNEAKDAFDNAMDTHVEPSRKGGAGLIGVAPSPSLPDQLFNALKSPNPAQVAENMRKIVEGDSHENS